MRFLPFANPRGVRWHEAQLAANRRGPDFPASRSWARTGPPSSTNMPARTDAIRRNMRSGRRNMPPDRGCNIALADLARRIVVEIGRHMRAPDARIAALGSAADARAHRKAGPR